MRLLLVTHGFWLCLAVAALSSVACVGAPESELPGDYVESHPKGRILLTLRSDNTFLEIVETPGIASVRAEGKWTYSPKDAALTLDGAVFPGKFFGDPQYRDYKKLEKGGLWGLSVERGLAGDIRLVDSPDFDLAFKKVGVRSGDKNRG